MADGVTEPAVNAGLAMSNFADVNKHLEMLRDGDIAGRAVLTFAETGELRREKEMVA